MYYGPYTYRYPNYSNVPMHTHGNPISHWSVPNELVFGSYQSFYDEGINVFV